MPDTVAVPRGDLEELLSRFQDYAHLVDGEWPGDMLGDDYDLVRKVEASSRPVTPVRVAARESGIAESRIAETIIDPDHPKEIDREYLGYALGMDVDDCELYVGVSLE